MRIHADRLSVNAKIQANGHDNYDSNGDSSGGAIWLTGNKVILGENMRLEAIGGNGCGYQNGFGIN